MKNETAAAAAKVKADKALEAALKMANESYWTYRRAQDAWEELVSNCSGHTETGVEGVLLLSCSFRMCLWPTAYCCYC